MKRIVGAVLAGLMTFGLVFGMAASLNLTSDSLGSATTVVAAWMGSPGHRANILSTTLNSVGAGAQAGRGAVWATADFGAAG